MVVQADPVVLRGVPEFFENNLEECLISRTESLGTFNVGYNIFNSLLAPTKQRFESLVRQMCVISSSQILGHLRLRYIKQIGK